MKEKNKLTLVFDNEKAKEEFISSWLDSGLDGGGNLDWDTKLDKCGEWVNPKTNELRIAGTGRPFDENGEIIEEG